MKIVTCFKVVPDDQDLAINADRTLNFDRAAAAISAYDLNAIEAGVALVEQCGGEVTALSVGGAWIDDSKLRKNVLSRGPGSLTLVADETLADLDTHNTARVLKAALSHIDDWSLVVCGDGSADVYAQQVGAQLGALLNVPVLNCVSALREENGTLVVERSLENETQVLELPLPAVISVTSDSNKPRIAGMKQILAAGKKPVEVFTAGDLTLEVTPTGETVSTLAPPEASRKHDIVDGDGSEAVESFAAKLIDALK
jgi:electron transfer flavoprotein beta subunit